MTEEDDSSSQSGGGAGGRGGGGAARASSSRARAHPAPSRSSARLQSSTTTSSSSPRNAPAPPPSTRQSRRKSVDPYPTRPPPNDEDETAEPDGVAPSASSNVDTRLREGPTPSGLPVPSGSLSPREEELSDEIMDEEEKAVHDAPETSRPPTRGRSSSVSTATAGKVFELVVIQQPEIGAETGLEKMTLGRLPIVPAPVVKMIVRDESGQEVDVELPYLFCTCALKQEDGTTPVQISRREAEEASHDPERLSALLGNLVRNAHRVTDLDGNLVSVFVFEDMSVREKGRYTLEFRLGEAGRPKSPRLAAVVSEPFDVVPWEEYPGRKADDILTPLSRHLHEQSVPLYIPPLVLAPETSVPLPPGKNPWPSSQILPFNPDELIPLPPDSPPAPSSQ
ncbi:hypothetical protein T439DRAFT_380592 [Meredithblackwellia eburnea MCA 4105]